MDKFDKRIRSKIMASIRSKNTSPELRVRSIVHRLGYRFRLHSKKLPGSPDLVFPSRQKVIFVHGCFWHRHNCPVGRKVPLSHKSYWLSKFTRNKKRDARRAKELHKLGWKVLVIWECEIGDCFSVTRKLKAYLGQQSRNGQQKGFLTHNSTAILFQTSRCSCAIALSCCRRSTYFGKTLLGSESKRK